MWLLKLLHSSRMRIALALFFVAVLCVSVLGVWRSVSSAAQAEEIPPVTYRHVGEFDYAVALAPALLYGELSLDSWEEASQQADSSEQTAEEPGSVVLFRDILEEVNMYYTCDLEGDVPLGTIDSEVVVSIIASNEDFWEREVSRFFESHRGFPFEMRFPLDVERLENEVEDIEDDIGISESEHSYRIVMSVDVDGVTSRGSPITGHFEHEVPMLVGEKTVELEGELVWTSTQESGEVVLTHSGRLDYDAYLEFNELYDEPVLRSFGLPTYEEPVAEPTPASKGTTLGPGHVYFTRLVESIDGTFDYSFDCDVPISSNSSEVTMWVELEAPDLWTRVLPLVEPTELDGMAPVRFPIDFETYCELIDAIEEEVGARAESHIIRIVAQVETEARTDAGRVEDTYLQSLEGVLESNTLRFQDELSVEQQGTVSGASLPPEQGGDGWRTPWLLGVVVGALGIAGVVIAGRRYQLAEMPAGDAEAARISRKYRQYVVDVKTPPERPVGSSSIELIDIERLVRIAADAGKPVLHHASNSEHRFLVLDENALYEYLVRREEQA